MNESLLLKKTQPNQETHKKTPHAKTYTPCPTESPKQSISLLETEIKESECEER